ncbi:MAG: tRNA (adenosine(37)-N6)-dimethylallyltransferase MiaA [Ekhidna sp.]
MSTLKHKPLLISVVGPTAVGKTAVAIEIAKKYQTEIVSADSRQFYKEMEIGTAKPTPEELSQVPHHFVNSHTIKQHYSAGEFGRDAEKVLNRIFAERRVVVLVGGSTLYLKALWEGFDEMPEVDAQIREALNSEFRKIGLEPLLNELQQKDEAYYNQVDRNNHQRVIRALEVIRATNKPFSSFRKASTKERHYQNLKIGLNMGRSELFDRINRRIDIMIKKGLFEEAASLQAYKHQNALQTVGYSEIFDFLDGAYDQDEAIRLLKRNSRRYAKRQLTWFNRYDDIHWFHPQKLNEIFSLIDSHLS